MSITYWQQAAGDNNRNYAEICIKHDVILNGPGEYGNFIENNDRYHNSNLSSRKITDIRRFSHDMKEGDVVVLRIGTFTVVAVGVIVGIYEWLDCFGDVDGWDLEHVRRVKWLWFDLNNPKEFSTYTMKLGDTTQQLTSQEVITWIDSLNLNFDSPSELIQLPDNKDYSITFDDIENSLFSYGVSDVSIKNLSAEFDSLVRIASWYSENDNPSEFETVAYLSVPLLRTLGWTPQKMAIEWCNVDIALFRNLPRTNEKLSIVVEAKRKDSSCLTAFSQAERYAIDKENCRRLIVTDGLRYGVYIKEAANNAFRLYAYANLLRLQEKYPIYSCHGASEAFKAMTPEWNENNDIIPFLD